jgi:membrane protease YdiL (CAAX protease family)
VTPAAAPPTGSFAAQSGLRRPQAPLLRPPDSHLLLALLAAVPVWALLAAGAGGTLRAPTGLWGWLSLLLVQPVLEELVFRGILQGQALRLLARRGSPRRLGPVTWANLLVTLLFVALHLLAQPPAWALAVAAPSLVFGHLRERFASVGPPMLAHAVYNTGFALAALLAGAPA